MRNAAALLVETYKAPEINYVTVMTMDSIATSLTVIMLTQVTIIYCCYDVLVYLLVLVLNVVSVLIHTKLLEVTRVTNTDY